MLMGLVWRWMVGGCGLGDGFDCGEGKGMGGEGDGGTGGWV